METTKYIVNNLSAQTINGNLVVTGTTKSNNYGTYKVLLTQTAQIVGTSLNDFNRALIIGEEYTITNYSSGDDFSNVANVTSGVLNETGCIFIATGTTPSIWVNSSELTSSGNLVVDVLENTLGFEEAWNMNLNGQDGMYYMVNNSLPFIYNTFPRDTTIVNSQVTAALPPLNIQIFAQPFSYTTKDDVIIVNVYDYDLGTGVNNKLYFTPVEINIKQDPNTTPIVVSGTVESNYSFNNVSVDLKCGATYIENFVGDGTTVSDLTELITQLNANEVTSSLGTYSDDGNGGVLLTIATNKANQFCSSGTLNFEVYSD